MLVLFSLSGACALIYEVLWIRWFGLLLGNFATATAVVLGTFMGGLAMGSALFGRAASRLSPRGALALYGVLEVLLCGLAALSPALLASATPLYMALARTPAASFSRLLVCAGLLLPPTVLMGGTLPALVRALAAASPRDLGVLYSLNTVGAALGTLAAAFLLIPHLGLQTSIWGTCAVNAVVAASALGLARSWRAQESPAPIGMGAASELVRAYSSQTAVYFLAGLSGFAALGFEVALTRLTILTVTGSSVYALALILSCFLAGISLGAGLLGWVRPSGRTQPLLAFALAQSLVWLFSLTTPFWDMLPPRLMMLEAQLSSFTAVQGVHFLIISALMLGATVAFGYSLPVLSVSMRNAGSAEIGNLFAFNTVGALGGAWVTGLLLLPTWGLAPTLLSLGSLALLTAAGAAVLAYRSNRPTLILAALSLAALPVVLPRPDEKVMNAGMYNRPDFYMAESREHRESPSAIAGKLGEIIYQKEGVTARIAVRASSAASHMACIVNGKVDGSTGTGDMHTQLLLAHLPVALHPNPRSVLVIGLGTGITVGSLTLHPEVEEVHVAEIEPAQLEAARLFRQHNHAALDSTKVRVHLDDARHMLLVDAGTYDVIVSEPSNLWVSGMVNLFTEEFYQLVRKRLRPGGVFAQWIHYYRVTDDDLRGLSRTVQSVFPESTVWAHQFGDALIIAGEQPLIVDPEKLTRRMGPPLLTADLARIGVEPEDMIAYFLWGPADMARYSRGGRLCTDDDPFLEFTTARLRYSSDDVQGRWERMQSFGPVDPTPFGDETVAKRVRAGRIFAERGNWARSRAEYQRAIEIEPHTQEALLGLERLETATSLARDDR